MTAFQFVDNADGWAQIKASADVLLRCKGVADVKPKERRKAIGLADLPVEGGKYGKHQVVVLGYP